MSSEREILGDTKQAGEKLRKLENPNPLVTEFSRFLADRIGAHEIVPTGFVVVSTLALYDLEHGVDGITHEPIKNSLVGRTAEEYKLLFRSLPGLARESFSQEFADEVEKKVKATKDEAHPQIEAIESAYRSLETPSDPNIILVDIEDISQAQKLIIDDAIAKILALDWAHFGVNDKSEMEKLLGASCLLTLRNAGVDFQLNILISKSPREKKMLQSIPDVRKSMLIEDYWLVMFENTILADEATFMRDWLWMKGPEAVVLLHKLPMDEVLKHFVKQDPSFKEAVFRSSKYFQHR